MPEPVTLRLMLNLRASDLRGPKGLSMARVARVLALLAERMVDTDLDKGGEVLSLDGELIALWVFDTLEEVVSHAEKARS